MGIILMSPVGLLAQRRGFTVVLDAGHGGKDPGAVSYGVREKDIVLDVVLRLGELIKSNHPEVKVLYTRKTDVFVTLQGRSDFANRHNASLFISVHVNSAGKKSPVRGTETYVLGVGKQASNLNAAMRENKVMMLEDDYKTTYRGFDPSSTESYIMFDLMQEAYIERSIEFANLMERQYVRNGRSSRGVRQAPLWVLSQSAMPSVLTELGFITSEEEAQYLSSKKGVNEMAGCISRAFTKFYSGRDASSPSRAEEAEVPEPSHSDEETTAREDREIEQATRAEKPIKRDQTNKPTQIEQPSKRPKADVSSSVYYRVQFMSSPDRIDTDDSQFARIKRLGYKVRRVREGRHWIYTVGNESSLSNAKDIRAKVRKHYADCFIVEYSSAGKRMGRVR